MLFASAGISIKEVKRKVFFKVFNAVQQEALISAEYWNNSDLNIQKEKVPKYTDTHKVLEQVESVNRFNLCEKKLAFTIKATRPTFFGHEPCLKVQVCNLSAIKDIAGIDHNSQSNGDHYEVWFEYCHKRCVNDILFTVQKSLDGLKM